MFTKTNNPHSKGGYKPTSPQASSKDMGASHKQAAAMATKSTMNNHGAMAKKAWGK